MELTTLVAGPDPPFARGAFVHVTYEGRTLAAMVVLASTDGVSLAIMFDGLLGGYVGMMPILWHEQDREYHDLFTRGVVVITPAHGDDDR